MSVKDLRQAAADTTQAAAERGTELVQEAIARIQPLVEQAGERVAPVAHDAKVKTADFAARKLDAWQPGIHDALDKVTPAVDAARSRVQDDLLPKLSDLLHDAAEYPVVEAKPKKKSKLKRAAKVVAIGALAAAAVAAVRQFLTSKDDGWTAHEPSKAYVNSTNNFSAEEASSAEETPAPEAEAADAEVVDAEPVAEPAPDTPESSYVGENPPEGFTIKGNERSMKYHLPGTGGFERTIPDVWFSSEEAAQAAGFTKAQR